MQYDRENKLITYTKAGVTTTYHYDGDGQMEIAGLRDAIRVFKARRDAGVAWPGGLKELEAADLKKAGAGTDSLLA